MVWPCYMYMKKNVLYIGNALSNNGKTVTTIETLALQLKGFCSVKIASRKSNKVLRLIDMVNTVISNRRWAEVVLIDIKEGFAEGKAMDLMQTASLNGFDLSFAR